MSRLRFRAVLSLFPRRGLVFGALIFLEIGLRATPAGPPDDSIGRLENLRRSLIQEFSVPIESWRRLASTQEGLEGVGIDESQWTPATLGATWPEDHVWLRAKTVIPEQVGGQSVKGLPVRLDLGIGSEGLLYLDGRLREWFHWDTKTKSGVEYTLTEQAQPGREYLLAINCTSPKKSGRLYSARLVFDVLPDLDRYCDEVEFLNSLLAVAPPEQIGPIKNALAASEAQITVATATADNLDFLRREIAAARAALAPVAAFTRGYDVYYVGHSHIDMNWLWTWEETIDVCHRTWNTAMNLMDEFPFFHFVQSQPAAYVPIEERYPEEFARMRQKVRQGQWDLVGGMWNESDDDMPSGEALARSLLLGQTYFKEKFGHYAVTGWLPDSFGHNWQLPQLMQLAGLRYFYHTRCANGLDFTWWQAPDGSRVLKANSYKSYDANINLDQLAKPWVNAAQFQTPQSLVVFGVGDHGGGPTREQILRGQNFQNDPILPRIHFVSADAFFEQLAAQPAAAAFPVMDTDLEYFDEGCYTTHADIKKAVRGMENSLYTAEMLSSLATLAGHPADSRALAEAWKSVAFAQFHDIMAGSAIHSTYDWMREQLHPAEVVATHETSRALATLTAGVDTEGATPIVVWNPLSFIRDDVVRVKLSQALRYHSVTDRDGHIYPAQAAADGELVFIARQVPAFGNKVYFPSEASGTTDGIALTETPAVEQIETSTLSLHVDRATGALSRLYLKPAQWDALGPAANTWQILGESGNAWHIRYTGTSQILTGEGGQVSVVEKGPVFVRLRISHPWGKSSFVQDLVAYGALPRIDIFASVDWHEQNEMAKIQLPINVTSPVVETEIPFGSIRRPDNGQECPAQKWTDVSQVDPLGVTGGEPLDLSALWNVSSAANFDNAGHGWPGARPASGLQHLGVQQVPFLIAGGPSDCVIPSGQEVPLPPGSGGRTLYFLGASVAGSHWTSAGFHLADGQTEARAFALNDWKIYRYPDNSGGMRDLATWSFADNEAGWSATATSAPSTLWIVPIPVPVGATSVRLPLDPQMRLFAATVASTTSTPASHGLSILNDGKYGFDVSGNVYRLTALRSTDKPDPTPEQSRQDFTYSLYPHAGDWRAARTDDQALALNIPLLPVLASSHPGSNPGPAFFLINAGGKGNLIVSAFKQSEDGRGSILRFYESQGADTIARIAFDRPVTMTETDLLERPLARHPLTLAGNAVTLPVGHNQIVTLRIVFVRPGPAGTNR